MSGPDVAANAAIVLIAGGTLVGTNRYSAWLLGTVWELDAAREVQAQLAVTEERLRFGRDLHDVMGRNLAVIALKSELAVELARRGRPEAVEQMIEVQRLAQESQREVRDVVRGYRKADLAVELSGALSVLRAAGVESRAEWDEGGSGRALPAEVQAALAWVIREATTNVLRHSEAERCVIRLSVEDGGPGLTGVSGAVSGAVSSAVLSAVSSAVLSVENDGVAETSLSAGSGSRAETAETLESSEPSAAGEQGPGFASGSGLAGLRERLAVLDGTLRTESRAGSFRLTALVPLPLPLPRRDTSATAPSPRP
jgi:two-component system sensor histidine kinase DesK